MTLETFPTTNVKFQFDDSAFTATQIPQVRARAQAMAAACEADFATLCEWFGVVASKSFGPTSQVVVTLDGSINGGVNSGYSTHNSQMTTNPEIGGSLDFAMFIFIAELSEVFMSLTGGLAPGFSGGEGLSRVAAELLHPASAIVKVNAWLLDDPTKDPSAAVADDAFQKDWISQNFEGGPLKKNGKFVPGDQDVYSVSCAMLYLFYLKSQLDFTLPQMAQTMPQVTKTGASTLARLYQQLTHATVPAYPQFKRFVDVHFPVGSPFLTTNNPFPLSLTNVTPSSVGASIGIYVFVAMPDGRLVYNLAEPGDAFQGWQDLTGAENTTTGLASAVQANNLYVFSRRADGEIVFNRTTVGGAFGAWQLVPGGATTDVAPAAVGRPSELFLFTKSLDGQVMFNQIAPSGALVGWQAVPGGLRVTGPVAAGMQNQSLFVFANSVDGSVQFNQAAPGGAFVGWQTLPNAPKTALPLAAAGRAGNLFVFLVDTTGQIHFNQAAPGGPFVGWQVMPGDRQTAVAVGAGMQNNTLFVFARIADGRIVFNQAAEGGAFAGWQLLR
jgi:hypothetical protein